MMPLPLRILSPPYVTWTHGGDAPDNDGGILCAALPTVPQVPFQLVAEIDALQRAHPGYCVACIVPPQMVGAFGLIRRAAQASRVLISSNAGPGEVVRIVAASRPAWQDVHSWLRAVGPRSFHRQLLLCADLLAGEDITGKAAMAATRDLRDASLPSPVEWLRMSKALQVMAVLWADSSKSIEAAALEGGFHDGATFSRSLYRLTGCRPGYARSRVGWEWLLCRFLGLPRVLKKRDVREVGLG